MLKMLILGPKQPGNDIDVYLAPLIENIKMLWQEGVECFDGDREETFTLRVLLLWTINDFSAYGNLSVLRVTMHIQYVGRIHVLKGWSTDGKFVTWVIDDFYHKLTVFINKRRRSMEK